MRLGCTELNAVDHSLKPPGFSPRAYKVKKLVSRFAFKFNLCRYFEAEEEEKPIRGGDEEEVGDEGVITKADEAAELAGGA
jgi:hypothetical protein